jgi:hypothetical protein
MMFEMLPLALSPTRWNLFAQTLSMMESVITLCKSFARPLSRTIPESSKEHGDV